MSARQIQNLKGQYNRHINPELFGEKNKRCLESEAPARLHARRSLVAACSIKSGATITSDMLTWKRPGHGISPSEIDRVLKKRASSDISEDEILTWEKLSGD